MFGKILVPLDGSELAEGILPFASQFAKRLDVPVSLLTVLDPQSVGLTEPEDRTQNAGTSELSKLYGVALAEPKSRLDHVVDELAGEGIAASSTATLGNPAEEILKVAEQERCGLIAMATHGRNPLARGILGSVTDKVIQSSNQPVLTIAPARAEENWADGVRLSTVLVPLDGSALAETVLPYVEYLAKGMSLEVVLVRSAGGAGSSAYSAALLHAGGLDLDTEIDARNRLYLEEIAESLSAKGLNVQYRLPRGAPAYAIVDEAKKTPNNIIALTTRGRSGFTRWAMGSVADALVRASGDPVLVVPPHRRS